MIFYHAAWVESPTLDWFPLGFLDNDLYAALSWDGVGEKTKKKNSINSHISKHSKLTKYFAIYIMQKRQHAFFVVFVLNEQKNY
jgi:hypothetical protein